mgnify:CR=1 FL=1
MLGVGSSLNQPYYRDTFVPSDISDLIAWYDFTDATTIYTTQLGSTTVNENDDVGAVLNKAPAKNQDQAYSRLGLRLVSKNLGGGALNGGVFKGPKDGIYFGSNQWLWNFAGIQGYESIRAGDGGEYSQTIFDTENCTIFVALKPEDSTISSDHGILGLKGRNNGNSAAAAMQLKRLNSNESISYKCIWEGASIADGNLDGSVNIGTKKQVIEIAGNDAIQDDLIIRKHTASGTSIINAGDLDSDSGGGKLKLDKTTPLGEAAGGSGDGDGFIVGAFLDEVGMQEGGSFKGHIMEVLIYNAVLTQSQKASVEVYLRAKHLI